jgi:hypothetical protein
VEYFLSHAGPDKPIVRQLGVQLQLAGADVFFDEWDIAAGESITGAIEQAIGRFDTFLLVWSANAEKSLWIRREYRAAVKKVIEDPSLRLVVIRLDDTPVPDLVSDLKYVRLANSDIGGVVDEIMGFKTQADRVKAIQAFLEEASIEVIYIPGYGPIVGCPRCGAGLEHIGGWQQTDYERDDVYAGAKCNKCGWNDGGEI